MSPVVDATTDREGSIEACVDAVRRGEVVVIPTDTVYGIGADAFDPAAVNDVLEAKGRGRDMPPPVLVPDARTIDGLARDVPDAARRLVESLWPGPLTLVLWAQPSLHWDLGETAGTVALRMPDDEVALAVLRETGPLAVTSANRTGESAATSVTDAAVQLGPSVAVYVDGGPRATLAPSTILDCTGDHPRVLREGAIDRARLEEVLGADFDTAPDAPFAPEEQEGEADTEAGETTDAAPAEEWNNPQQADPVERAQPATGTTTDTPSHTEASDDR
ncbi:L-threonylcarbamoyladenylate synthase [Janibacter cremeus]|uniref:L-threonylcarbamoyladenylate synthase n=1 Tax=Janibacter cremeus TaxID=1285192 RepID=A0A852VNS9_9MICO|nr:L-threonylcarbamoyladenylate synthase [Janibacter cremeus]NYF97348.1 tRNA threonylcarbamoyl adenosine modification protein (Sua5/YciO/YrdC/YwlC family) [Janibacter cremeus]